MVASKKEDHHVVIMGGGAMGSCISYYLVKDFNYNVTLVDPCASNDGSSFEPPAASGRAGGFLAQSWCDGTSTEELTRLSYALHQELSHILDSDYRTLNVYHAKKDKEHEHKKRQSCRAKPPSYCDLGGISHVSSETTSTSACAQVLPHKFVRSLQSETLRLGGVSNFSIVCGRVVGIRQHSDGSVRSVLVEKDGDKTPKEITCDAFVAAAGPWTNECRSWGAPFDACPPIEGLKAHSIVVRASSADATALFLSFSNGCGEMEYYPRPDGTMYVCGEGEDDSSIVVERPGMVACNSQCITKLKQESASISSLFDTVNGSELHVPLTLRESACHLPVVISSTGSPLICELEKDTRCYLAVGHSCWGILQSPGTGKALAELIATGTSTLCDLSNFQIENCCSEVNT